MAARRLADLSPAQRRLLAVAATAQLALLAAALTDIARRPADQIHGPKKVWVAAAFVNFVGPAAYFTFGRKRRRDVTS